MLQFIANIQASILHYFQTTPVDQMAAHALFAVGWVPIAGILVWGLIQVWQDNRQGIYVSKLKWQLLQIHVPADAIQTPKGMENFFTNIAGSKSSITWKEKWLLGKFQAWFSLEIVSIGGDIRFYIRCIQKYRDVVESALYAQYPEASISEVEDYIDVIPDEYPNGEWDVWGTEMTLRRPSELPIRTWIDFEHQGEKDQRLKDPLLPMLEGLGKMLPGEMYWLQILIMQPDDQDWRKAGIKKIQEAYGKEEKKKKSGIDLAWVPAEVLNQVTGGGLLGGEEAGSDSDQFAAFRITPQEKEQLDGISRKISKLGWYTKVRFVYAARPELYRKGTIASMSKGIFHQYANLSMNKFGIHGPATPKDDYFWQEWQMERKKTNLVKRYKGRSFGTGATPVILNTEELATLFHFPAADARTPVLTSLGSRRAEAPTELHFAGLDEPDLPNMTPPASVEPAAKKTVGTPAPLATPRPTAPTSSGDDGPVRRGGPMSPPGDAQDVGAASVTRSSLETRPPASPLHDENVPQPGMPAPLPPGLDLSDEPVESMETPNNLPV